MQEPVHSEWSGRTDGTPFMQKALIAVFKVVPLEVIYGVMALVVPFYMLFNHKGYTSMYHFFRRRLGKKPLSAFWHVYLNHFAFGQVVLDRFATYAGRRFKLEIDGNENFLRLCEGEKGFVMLSSHVGNYEQAGYMLRSDRKSFNALVYAGESATVMSERNKQFAGSNIHMIPVQADMSHLFIINKSLDEGNIVSMPADRCFGSTKSVPCQFFGATAQFPLGPFATAVQKEVPALAVMVMKEGAHRYRAFVRQLPVDTTLPHRKQMAALAQSFATTLEEIVRRYPHQWYNYYEFWDGE